jgi:hypothetical protein
VTIQTPAVEEHTIALEVERHSQVQELEQEEEVGKNSILDRPRLLAGVNMQLVEVLDCTAVVEGMVKRREVVGNLTEDLDWGRMVLGFATDQPWTRTR